MNILGISAGFHDCGITLLNDGEIAFAGHSERYSKAKHDEHINKDIVLDAIQHGDPDVIAYYEKPWLKKLRQLRAGQYDQALDLSDITISKYLAKHLPGMFNGRPTRHFGHHRSHAAAGFQTSPYTRATVVVIDAIGEFDTVSIWAAEYNSSGTAQYRLLWRQGYPHSIGLFYSAFTKRVGLKPLDEEYILMGMAAYGERGFGDYIKQTFVHSEADIEFKQNFHVGLDPTYLDYVGDYDIAAGAQDVCETLVYNVMARARAYNWSTNLVYMGGVALNCLANRNLGDYFDNIWIMPNPGDAGSSLGAAALAYGKKVQWNDAYLGHNIPGAYPVNNILDRLLSDKIVGVASGRAEFGPRALGNRSLLADPRGQEIKDKVNEIKRRQKFRPFAPVILAEQAELFFDMPRGFNSSPYMQAVAYCKRPDLFPAIVHHDGTSRVQTVEADGSGIRQLLEKWFVMTGCPMLLNTSLNIRGEPMVNDRRDADRFEQQYGVKVCS